LNSRGSTTQLISILSVAIGIAGADKLRSRSNGGSKRELPPSNTKEGHGPPVQIAAQTFTFRELAAATKNFRPESFVGEGGFGRVYKGRLETTGQVQSLLFTLSTHPMGKKQSKSSPITVLSWNQWFWSTVRISKLFLISDISFDLVPLPPRPMNLIFPGPSFYNNAFITLNNALQRSMVTDLYHHILPSILRG